ncbi:MAG TPA: MATE family efflux transporter [Firmicutes bacterium]|nr:MATE family efflux transporter [Bacillota bacterium]
MDMTRGRPLSLLCRFALPLMAGNVCQQLYVTVDTLVVGRGVGVDALATLGAADWPTWSVLSVIIGLVQGFSLLVAQRFGAKDQEGVHRSVAVTLWLSLFSSLGLTVVALLGSRPLLQILQTPPEILEGALLYVRILFGCILFNGAYNAFSSILRALGDSRTPLIAMLIASVSNILLDLLFVLGFHWGVMGAAVGTVMSQLISALICLRVMLRMPQLRMSREERRWDGKLAMSLVKLGAPMALQNLIIAVGGLFVQWVVNQNGVLFVAGYTATNKLYGLLELAAVSFGFAMSTFAGQNLGAGHIRRIRQGMRTAACLGIGVAVVIAAAMLLFGRAIVACFVSGDTNQVEQVVSIGYQYLCIMSWALPVLYLLHQYRSALQGMGNTVAAMVSGFFELFMRVLAVLTLPHWLGEVGIFYAEPLAWIGAVIVLAPCCYRRIRDLRTQYPEKESPAA